MVVFLDTNVIVDYFDQRELFQEAEKIFDFCCLNENQGVVASLSFSHFFYLFRKTMTAQDRKEDIRLMTELFMIASVDEETVKKALALDMEDYEDAIQAACAERCHARWIVTNNVRDFAKSPVKPITPGDFVKCYCSERR